MVKRFVQGMFVVLCLCMAYVSCAANTTQTLLVVRPDSSSPPHEMVVDGKVTGIHIELVREAAKELNISVIFKSYPWKRVVRMLKDGEADAVTFMSRRAGREKFGYFFEGNILSKGPIGLFVLKEHEDDIHFSGDLKELQSYTIGTVLGYSYYKEFNIATYLTKDDGARGKEELLKKFINKDFKIAIGYVNDIKYYAKQMGIANQIVFLRPYLSEGRTNYIVFSKAKKHEALAKQFANAIEAFKSTTRYHKLLKKYGVEEE